MNSIRQRLLLWLLAGIALLLAASGYATYRQARGEINALFDYQLQQMALALRNQNLLTLAIGTDSDGGDLLVQIWDRGRGLLYVSQPQSELPFATQAGFSDLVWRDQAWRLFALYAGTRVVQIAQPLGVRLRMSADIALHNLLPFLLLLPGIGFVVWFGVGAGLRPLDRIAADIQRRRPSALEPAPVERLPREITPLLNALNELLARLAQTLERQRQFIADAAHELRTPLTAVRLQADLARQAVDGELRAEALRDLGIGLERATHLVEQLLALARVDASPTVSRAEPVDLLDLAKQTIAAQAAIADTRHLDLGLLQSDFRLRVTGNSNELRTLLDNLVDNALRYTPPGGRVGVSVYSTEKEVVLAVQDTGPGIPPAEQARVFDRFYRSASTATPGSGLGLAIVKGIADRHGARIRLSRPEEGPGLRVTVHFPLL